MTHQTKQLVNEQLILDSFVMEMANLPTQKTGLTRVIWFGEVGGQHGPRIKVSNVPGKFDRNDNFVMSVEKNPRVLTPNSCKLGKSDIDDISDWIKINYEVLMDLYYVFENEGLNPTTGIISDFDETLSKLIKI